MANILQATLNLAKKLALQTPAPTPHPTIPTSDYSQQNFENTLKSTEPETITNAQDKTNEVFIKILNLKEKMYSD